MRSGPKGRILCFTALAVAAVSVAAGGGFVTMPGRAAGAPCSDTPLRGGAPDGTPLPCEDAVPEQPPTETNPVDEPPTAPTPETTTPEPTTTEPTATSPEPTPPPPTPAPRRAKPAPTTAGPKKQPAPAPLATRGSPGALVAIPDNGIPTLGGGPYVFPVAGDVSFTDTWGAARSTVAWHHGVDFFAPLGTPVVAVADGTLFSVGWNTIGGRRLWLRDRAGNYFYYAHLSGFASVAVDGARVTAGTVVGYVGHTGDAMGTPDHLHFEIHPVSLLPMGYDGAVDPFTYVSSWPRLDEAGELRMTGAVIVPGAILLGSWDISRASGSSPASLERAIDHAAASAAGKGLPSIAPTRRTLPAAGDDDARIARSLDAGAVRTGWSVWDLLAGCESSGRWGANTGNGFVGGLQFLPSTWATHGGTAFAPSPERATREQQIAVARRVLATQGWQAWPACSTMLGLRAIGDE